MHTNLNTDSQLRSSPRLTAFSGSIPGRLRIASILNVIAGAIPLTVGTVLYTLTVASIIAPADPWLSNGFSFGEPPTFSLDSLAAFNQQAASSLRINSHVGYANLMMSGLTILLMGLFALPMRWKPGFFLLLIMAAWSGGNDAVAVIMSGQTPIPLIPSSLTLIGVFLAYPYVFQKGNARKNT